MAQQTIDIGTVANDGTGDPIRDAFDKCNDNFGELYAGLTGLLDFKGSTDCSAEPDYPAASKGDFYLVSVAGKIGGASGVSVQAGDSYFATADNAGGDQATVGTSWTVVQGNLIVDNDTTLAGDSTTAVPSQHAVKTYVDNEIASIGGGGGGDLLAANNLSDVSSKVAAKDNISVKGSDIASASTTDLSGATGDFVTITGTTTITAFGTCAAGVERTLHFSGALTLTHNATSLILPTGADIVTAAGDTAVFRSRGSGNWRCISYQRASGRPFFRGALVTKSADQTGANFSSPAMVTFNSESYDTDNFHDNVTNTSRLTVPSGVSKVRISYAVTCYLVNANAEILTIVKKNGTTYNWPGVPLQYCDTSDTNPRACATSAVVSVSAGDYFELELFIPADNSVSVIAGYTWFAIEVIE